MSRVGRTDEPGAPSSGVVLGELDPGLRLAEDRVDLAGAIAHLPVRERRILELRFAAGMSQSEIAQEIGISQVHVSRLIRKSIRLLQKQLGHGGDEDDGTETGGDPDEG